MPRLADSIKPTRLVELAQTLVAIPSITNQEHEIADWVYEHFVARTYIQTAIDILGIRS